MRIIGGAFKGLALAAPKSMAIRPTSDRLRETLFNILAHGHGDPVSGARVLDLFAGTGALGLEALSRGARFCLFVEEAAEARGLIRRNIEATRQTGTTKLWRRDATRMGPCAPMEPFDIVFADPPYRQSLGDAALASARAGGWLRPGSLCVLEEAADAPFTCPDGLSVVDDRPMGESRLRFLTCD
jgi:16S rRNA (guanine966-N2)-methyltransferase